VQQVQAFGLLVLPRFAAQGTVSGDARECAPHDPLEGLVVFLLAKQQQPDHLPILAASPFRLPPFRLPFRPRLIGQHEPVAVAVVRERVPAIVSEVLAKEMAASSVGRQRALGQGESRFLAPESSQERHSKNPNRYYDKSTILSLHFGHFPVNSTLFARESGANDAPQLKHDTPYLLNLSIGINTAPIGSRSRIAIAVSTPVAYGARISKCTKSCRSFPIEIDTAMITANQVAENIP
jgi:hypothetical protein